MKPIFILCLALPLNSMLYAMTEPTGYECLRSEKPISATYAFCRAHAGDKTAFIEQLLANLNHSADRSNRWYATLALAVLGELYPEAMKPYLLRWAAQIQQIKDGCVVYPINGDHTFPEYPAPDGSHFVNLQEIGTEGGLGYFSQPAFATGKACTHVAVLKQDETEIKVDEIWVVLAGDGALALRNKIVAGQEHKDWNIITLQPGVVIKIPFGTPFQFRAGAHGFLVHDMTLPPWPGPQAADNTVEAYWK